MEEVPAHVHPGPIVTDVLSRQHEHKSGLIWSGDGETTAPCRLLCTTALGGARKIGGALVLVQIWAWSHIPTLRPQLMTEIQADPLAPLGALCLCGSLIMTTSMLQEVDNMASVTIIRWCIVSIGGTLGCTPSQHDIQAMFPVQPSRRRPREHVPDRGARRVKRGARMYLGRGAGGGRPPVPPAPQRQEHFDPGPAVVERGEGSGSGQ
ncbi:hypothetical protein M9H77_33997 [Catharanthus roseus]|uniref:Uncharacterized protein n=1 Tax=Catharanthus roseus TaxID=4058 RepID=A0ACB9ZJY9_CATRO|nr:hypothetical protein M9H77_33997 [Catharanthus roseus]